MVAGLSGAILLKIVVLRYGKTFKSVIWGKLQGSDTNMKIKFLWENSLKYLPLLSVRNSPTQFMLFLDLGFLS